MTNFGQKKQNFGYMMKISQKKQKSINHMDRAHGVEGALGFVPKGAV